jgi:hypothetical protein
MKKITLIAIALISLSSCADYSTTTPKDNTGKPLTPQRIHGVESTVYDGITYNIVEVDGNEFLCQYNGGMCLIPKDTTKKN